MSTCAAACGKPVGSTGVARCAECPSVYHKGCVGLPTTGRVAPSWACPSCKAKRLRDNADATPVKSCEDGESGTGASAVIPEERLGIAMELRLLREEFAATRNDIGALRLEIAGLQTLVHGIGSRIQAVEDRVQHLEEQVKEQRTLGGTADSDLAATVASLKLELLDRDQDLLLNDIEVTGIPESPNESPAHLTCLIAQKLGVDLEERDIVFAERVGPRRPALKSGAESPLDGAAAPASTPASGRPRPRPLVVRLARRGTRNELLRVARVRRGADTSDFGLSGEPSRFYVNERLTRLNRTLLYGARQECKRLDWRYSWTKDGRVYVRRQSGEPAQRIRSEDQIKQVFGLS